MIAGYNNHHGIFDAAGRRITGTSAAAAVFSDNVGDDWTRATFAPLSAGQSERPSADAAAEEPRGAATSFVVTLMSVDTDDLYSYIQRGFGEGRQLSEADLT